MKGGKYTKTLAKIWVEGVIRIPDIRGTILSKFIELFMEMLAMLELIRMSSNMADGNQLKHLLASLLQKRVLTPRVTHKH